jgi:hypothetical protein
LVRINQIETEAIGAVAQTLTNPQKPERQSVGDVPQLAGRRHPWEAPAFLRFWHLASLDAPTVAVVWSMSFAWAAGVRLPAWVPVLLALVTWAVYVGDRIFDAKAGFHTGTFHTLRKRHVFHWRYRRVLVPLAIAAACFAVCIAVLLMPARAKEHDTVLAVAALAYFSGIHGRRKLPALLPKELLVAVLFTAGCALPALNRAAGGSTILIALIAYFAALAWLNCHAIERWESQAHSGRIATIGGLLGLAGVLLAALVFAVQPHPAMLIAAGAASAFLLAILDRIRDRLTPLALRASADLVLLTPVLLGVLAR